MTTALAGREHIESKQTIQVTLTDAPPISFGQAGRLSPTEGSVERMVYGGRTHYFVRLVARNDRDLQMRGTWGWPYATEVPDYAYGYAGAGLINHLPRELLFALMCATGMPVDDLPEKGAPDASA